MIRKCLRRTLHLVEAACIVAWMVSIWFDIGWNVNQYYQLSLTRGQCRVMWLSMDARKMGYGGTSEAFWMKSGKLDWWFSDNLGTTDVVLYYYGAPMWIMVVAGGAAEVALVLWGHRAAASPHVGELIVQETPSAASNGIQPRAGSVVGDRSPSAKRALDDPPAPT